MKKVDPARYVGKRKAAELEIKTLGDTPPLEPIIQTGGRKAKTPTPLMAKKTKDRTTSNRSTGQSTDQSTNWSIDRLTDIDTFGPVVGKPRAFYITHRVDKWLDAAVEYLKEKKGIHKVDRSVIVNAFLHDPQQFEPEALNKLRERILAHLTNKSLKREQSTD